MRVCIITSDIDGIAFEEKKLMEVVRQFIDPTSVDKIYVTGYSWPSKKSSKPKVYPLLSRSTLKVKFSCFTLKNIDKYVWMPTFMAIPALWLIQGELIDTIASFDPEVIISTNFRWGKELSSFIRKMLGGFVRLSDKSSFGTMFQVRRNYDPSIKISIVLPTYNGSQYVKKSIDSCLNQTHRNLELIIVDDASTDNTSDIIKSFNDKRIKYIRNDKNLKLPRSLNTGFTHAQGDFLTWTSDDNFYDPEAIKTMLSVLCTYQKVDFVYAEQYAIDESGNILRYDEVRPLKSLRVSNPIGGCFLYRRKVAETIGEYNPGAFLAEDLDYWIRVSKSFHILGLRRPLYYYRYHEDSLTSKFSSGEVAESANLIREAHKLNIIK